ncbi:MAG: VOC family protein [Chloroflexota bacterium]
MITRFDHVLVAVQDLDHTINHYRTRLGLDANPGGRHTGRGTHNGIVRFGLDYIELLAVYDVDEIKTAGKRVLLHDYLQTHEGGMLAYCLATDDIDTLATHFAQVGLDAVGPFAMQRTRPDGLTLNWRLLIPDGTGYRRPWPFFIQWDLPDDERLQHEQPGHHALGATAVTGLSVVVDDFVAGKDLYSRQLGLTLVEERRLPVSNAQCVRYQLADFTIDVLAPLGTGAVQEYLDGHGQGVYEVTLRVDDLTEAVRLLVERGVSIEQQADGMVRIVSDDVFGARWVLN